MDLAERDAFLRNYRKSLGRIFDDFQAEVAGYSYQNNAPVTCREGCTACCSQFISVNVSHAIVAADYLNADKKAAHIFRSGYERWVHSFESNPEAAAVLRELETYTTHAAALKPYPQELCAAYHKLNIPCPFLDSGRCAIHKVRPVVCAAYFSLSPAADCAPDSTVQPSILEIEPAREVLKYMAGLTDSRLYKHQEPLPKLVNKLITLGLTEVEKEVEGLFEKKV